jgi:2-polyprenyl-3-methyl-5-hydroxy-6-metoxy-1,4-benzoquinol methylase
VESQYSVDVDPGRVNNSHSFVIQLVGAGKTVLELGAASGHVTRVLVSRGNRVTAVESDEACGGSLRAVATDVLITDLDWLSLTEDLQGRTFDVIVAGDVLEHTKRPELVLAQLHALLAPGGFVVATLPHIAHGDVRLALLSGQFPYAERGLLDRTHLKFFTRSNIVELFNSTGYTIEELYGTTAPLGSTELGVDLSTFSTEILRTVHESPDSDVYQFVVKATALERPNVSLLEEIAQVNRETSRSDLLAEVSALNIALRSTQNELRVRELQISEERQKVAFLSAEIEESKRAEKISSLENRDYIIGILAELGEAHSRLTILEKRQDEDVQRLVDEMTRAYNAESRIVELEPIAANVARLRTELQSLRSSRSFRIGQAMTAPVRVLRRLVR